MLEFPERIDSWQRWLHCAFLVSATFALYGASLYFNFVWDDFGYVMKNYRAQGLDWMHLRAIWTGTYLGHYAPMHHIFLAVLHHFSGLEPFGYHLGQVLVHAACVCLLYLVLKKIELPRVALLASLLFATYPANIETVAWVSETKSTLAFFFFLLSFWFFLRLRDRERPMDGIFCGLFLILSLLSKINTVVAPAIFLLYDYKQGYSFKKGRLWSLGCFFLISAMMAGIHLMAFHRSAQVMESAYYGGLGVHLMNMPLLLVFYLKMVVYPHPLSAWEMFPVQAQFTWLIGLGWAGMSAMVLLLARSRRSTQFWGLWIFIFLLPVLQIVPFPVWLADRYLYIPAVGGFVLASQFFFEGYDRLLAPWQRRIGECAMIAVLLLFAGWTQNHLPVWKNNLTLWESTVPTCMTSAYCHVNFGLALLEDGQIERGMPEMIRAVELRPSPTFLERLGDAYTLGVGDYRQAVIAYRMAVEKAGNDPGTEVYAKLARAHLLAGNLQEAERAIQDGKRVNPNDPTLWVIDGVLQWKLGNWEEARLSLRRSLAMTGRTSNAAGFIYQYWPNAAEVGKLLSDLRSAQSGNQEATSARPRKRQK